MRSAIISPCVGTSVFSFGPLIGATAPVLGRVTFLLPFLSDLKFSGRATGPPFLISFFIAIHDGFVASALPPYCPFPVELPDAVDLFFDKIKCAASVGRVSLVSFFFVLVCHPSVFFDRSPWLFSFSESQGFTVTWRVLALATFAVWARSFPFPRPHTSLSH